VFFCNLWVAFLCLFALVPGLFYGVLNLWDPSGCHDQLRFGLLLLCPVIACLGLGWIIFSRKGVTFSSGDPALKAVAKDEFRRFNALRAFRVAFVAVLAVQLPLAWVATQRPGPGSPGNMGNCTWLIGSVVYLAAFLFFDRD
jgi:hypothetical protein